MKSVSVVLVALAGMAAAQPVEPVKPFKSIVDPVEGKDYFIPNKSSEPVDAADAKTSEWEARVQDRAKYCPDSYGYGQTQEKTKECLKYEACSKKSNGQKTGDFLNCMNSASVNVPKQVELRSEFCPQSYGQSGPNGAPNECIARLDACIAKLDSPGDLDEEEIRKCMKPTSPCDEQAPAPEVKETKEKAKANAEPEASKQSTPEEQPKEGAAKAKADADAGYQGASEEKPKKEEVKASADAGKQTPPEEPKAGSQEAPGNSQGTSPCT